MYASYRGATIVMTNCTIVLQKCSSAMVCDITIVQTDVTIAAP